ncbi:hypothetical protein TNCV_3103901 [Trichonephila clavipes]|nr:hypothetical protein TNCV_3103901 [Trichonephila clavipes]
MTEALRDCFQSKVQAIKAKRLALSPFSSSCNLDLTRNKKCATPTLAFFFPYSFCLLPCTRTVFSSFSIALPLFIKKSARKKTFNYKGSCSECSKQKKFSDCQWEWQREKKILFRDKVKRRVKQYDWMRKP